MKLTTENTNTTVSATKDRKSLITASNGIQLGILLTMIIATINTSSDPLTIWKIIIQLASLVLVVVGFILTVRFNRLVIGFCSILGANLIQAVFYMTGSGPPSRVDNFLLVLDWSLTTALAILVLLLFMLNKFTDAIKQMPVDFLNKTTEMKDNS